MIFRPEIAAAAAAHGLDPDLVHAIVLQESGGQWFAYRYEPVFWTRYLAHHPTWRDRDPKEVSASYGLMQVMFTTAVEDGFTGAAWEMFNPVVALDNGCRHLAKEIAYMRTRYVGPTVGAEEKILMSSLASYNGGRQGNLPDDLQDRTRGYAEAIMEKRNRIKAGS